MGSEEWVASSNEAIKLVTGSGSLILRKFKTRGSHIAMKLIFKLDKVVYLLQKRLQYFL